MAQVTYDPLKDWVEIIRLANGDPIQTKLVNNMIVNNTVLNQGLLDQAIIDNAAGVLSSVQTSINREIAMDVVDISTLSAAILGDVSAISTLQTQLAIADPTTSVTLPAIPPTSPNTGGSTFNNFTSGRPPTISNDSTQGYSPGSVWIDTISNTVYTCSSSQIGNAIWIKGESESSKYVGSVIAHPASTLYVSAPLVDSLTVLPIGFSNVGGVITSDNTGDYLVSISVPFVSLNKYELQNVRILVDDIPIQPTLSTEAGKITKLGHMSSTVTVHMNAQSTIAVQYSGTVGTIYACYLSITEVR